MFKPEGHALMAQALQAAAAPLFSPHPNPRVGCVLEKNGEVVGVGAHEQAGFAHAEVNAIAMAGDRARGATAYVTLEPCAHTGKTAPCVDALLNAGVARVVAAMEDPNPQVAGRGLKRLAEQGVSVQSGLLQSQAEALNTGFLKRMRTGRPWLRIKTAMSLDGRTAMASGESQWISCADSRRDVQRWRARSSAIMTGIGTVLADDPSLTVREAELQAAVPWQPNRIIVDSHGQLPSDAKVLNLPGNAYLATTANADTSRFIGQNIKLLALDERAGRVDLEQLLLRLGALGENEIQVEAGPVLTGALLQQGLVDEILLYIAPHLLGDSARGLFSLPGLQQMSERISLQITDSRTVGTDLRIIAQPQMN